MSTLSFDLRDFGTSTAPAPTTTVRGAGVSLVVHGLGVSALILAPLLGATRLPETRDTFQAPLVRPITVSLPPPPIAPSRLPRGSSQAAAARSVTPDVTPPVDDHALTIMSATPDPGPGSPSDLQATDPTGTGLTGSGCAVGALCGPGPMAQADSQPKAIPHVGGVIREPRLLESRVPQYPPLAQATFVSGRVVVEAHVAQDGRVRDARITEGHPLFNESALASVRSRRYEPLLLNGVPTDFLITITVAFNIRR